MPKKRSRRRKKSNCSPKSANAADAVSQSSVDATSSDDSVALIDHNDAAAVADAPNDESQVTSVDEAKKTVDNEESISPDADDQTTQKPVDESIDEAIEKIDQLISADSEEEASQDSESDDVPPTTESAEAGDEESENEAILKRLAVATRKSDSGHVGSDPVRLRSSHTDEERKIETDDIDPRVMQAMDAMCVQFEKQTELVVDRVVSQIEIAIDRWTRKLENVAGEGSLTGDEDANSPLAGWDKKRSELLAQYGELDRPGAIHKKTFAEVQESQKSLVVDEPAEASAETNLADDEPAVRSAMNPAVQETTIANLDCLDDLQSEKIEKLKKQLTSQLREAEVELSISRARLSQQQSSMEQKVTELDRREEILKRKISQWQSTQKKSGLLDRWARHLTFRKPREDTGEVASSLMDSMTDA